MRRAAGVVRLLARLRPGRLVPGRARFARLSRFVPRRAQIGRLLPRRLLVRRFLAHWAGGLLAVPILGALVLTPTAHGAVGLSTRLADAASTMSRHASRAPATSVSARRFLATPAVGALFKISAGRLGPHFCTASVVDSPHGDLVITAAHCVGGKRPSQIAFVPGYHDGVAPYGVWRIRRIIVDAPWQRSGNINHDVAFLVVRPQAGTASVQAQTGGERLETNWSARTLVRVIGYPDLGRRPVLCTSRTRPVGRHQMRFDCGGYTDGTSGGPFLARWDPATGQGAVIGVIGGYEQGGDLASVSYSARFGHAVWALYLTAVSRS